MKSVNNERKRGGIPGSDPTLSQLFEVLLFQPSVLGLDWHDLMILHMVSTTGMIYLPACI